MWGLAQTQIAQNVNPTGCAWPLLFGSPAFEMQYSTKDEVTHCSYMERFQNDKYIYSDQMEEHHLENRVPPHPTQLTRCILHISPLYLQGDQSLP